MAAQREPPRANGAESRGPVGVYGRGRRPATSLHQRGREKLGRAGASLGKARHTGGAHGAACDTHGHARRGADEYTE